MIRPGYRFKDIDSGGSSGGDDGVNLKKKTWLKDKVLSSELTSIEKSTQMNLETRVQA